METLASLFRFRDPLLAFVAIAVFLLAFVMAVVPLDHVEKAGFMLASGFGVGYFVSGAKALRGGFSSLGLLMAILGVILFMSAWLATSPTVLAASVLEDQVPTIIGAGLGFFAKIEEG